LPDGKDRDGIRRFVYPVEDQLRIAGQGQAADTLAPHRADLGIATDGDRRILDRHLDAPRAARVAGFQISRDGFHIGEGLRGQA